MNKIALFDLDGTLADFNNKILEDLNSIASPGEPPINIFDVYNDSIEYLTIRRHIITSQVGWWLKLEKFKLGWDILEACKKLNFKIVVLTKGPSRKFNAWSEKVEWCNRHLSEYIDGVTITSDKSLVYGRVLVDDYPDYCENWLKHRPRGLVIMPEHPYNRDYNHPNVIKYNGTNINEVIYRLMEVQTK